MSRTGQHQYRRIAQALREKITCGQWQARMMLPSGRVLAQTYQVAVGTVERAVTLLVAEGLLTTDARRGTFVTETAAGDNGALPSSLQPVPTRDRTTPARIGIVADLYPWASGEAFDAQWALHLLRGCEQALSEEHQVTHYFLNRISGAGQPALPAAEVLAQMLDHAVDGMILLDQFELLAHPVPELRRHLPVIFVTTSPLHRTVHHVTHDQVAAGYLALEHLLQRGYRRVTTFFPFGSEWEAERLSGIREAQHQSAVNCQVIPFTPDMPPLDPYCDQAQVGYAHAPALLAAVASGEAIIACNDAVALGILRAASERGRAPGRDVGLLGFDDHPCSRTHGLTSIHPPLEAMGREAARLMRRALQGEAIPLQVSLAPYLMARASTGRT